MKTEDIEKIYYTKDEEIIALTNFSYIFEPGKFYAIMGHSGSGKSTLIRILGLIDTYTKGKYEIEGRDVSLLKDVDLSEIRMKDIGFVFQDFYLEEHLKAYENVMLPMLINKNIKKENRKKKAIELLNSVNLNNRINHYPKELSGGEQQRVCLARAIANDPNFILADEPTGNLDEKNEIKIFEILQKLRNKGKCIIVVSHSNQVKKYADVILHLKDGKLVK